MGTTTPPPEGSSRITQEKHEALVAFFRDHPGSTKKAAKAIGVHERTARRAWHEGWPNPEWAREPIKQTLLEEARGARAVVRAQTEVLGAAVAANRIQERELARLDAAAERAREAHALRATLSAAISGLAVLGTLSKVGVPVASATATAIMDAVAAKQLSYREGLAILSRLSKLAGEAGANLKASMESIRLHLGEPQQIIGTVGDPSRKSDALLAVEHFGPDLVKKAITDIFDGTVTAESERLLRWQLEQDDQRH